MGSPVPVIRCSHWVFAEWIIYRATLSALLYSILNIWIKWHHIVMASLINHQNTNSCITTAQICCFCSVTKSHLTLCNPMDCSTLGSSVLHHIPEFAQTQVHWVGDAIQPSRPLSSPSPPAFNLSQHQSLFQKVGSLHQVAKVLKLQLQHQSFQWIFRTNFL